MSNENQTPGQKIMEGLSGLLSQAMSSTPDNSDGDKFTLRYSTEKVELPVEGNADKSVATLFRENGDELGLPSGANFAVRCGGEASDGGSTPTAGSVYTASVARESNGN